MLCPLRFSFVTWKEPQLGILSNLLASYQDHMKTCNKVPSHVLVIGCTAQNPSYGNNFKPA